MSYLWAAAKQFTTGKKITHIAEYGQGHIHDTFLVTIDCSPKERLILQRVNTRVFPNPDLIMENIKTYSVHAAERLSKPLPCKAPRRWEIPRIIKSRYGHQYWLDPTGAFWRAFSFIEGAQSIETVENLEQAHQTGRALGMFHFLTRDLPPIRFYDTLPGFHITPAYLYRLDEILRHTEIPPSIELDFALEFINKRRLRVSVLEKAKEKGRLDHRIIHGDPKINNILFDIVTGEPIAMIDLDTVKPGLLHYDIADCLRSVCNTAAEENLEGAAFDLNRCRAFLEGYLALTGNLLTDKDMEYLYDAIHLIPFELGLRFLTDHLEGNVYFKVKYRGQNLLRALGQFRLTESIEGQEEEIRIIVEELR